MTRESYDKRNYVIALVTLALVILTYMFPRDQVVSAWRSFFHHTEDDFLKDLKPGTALGPLLQKYNLRSAQVKEGVVVMTDAMFAFIERDSDGAVERYFVLSIDGNFMPLIHPVLPQHLKIRGRLGLDNFERTNSDPENGSYAFSSGRFEEFVLVEELMILEKYNVDEIFILFYAGYGSRFGCSNDVIVRANDEAEKDPRSKLAEFRRACSPNAFAVGNWKAKRGDRARFAFPDLDFFRGFYYLLEE